MAGKQKVSNQGQTVVAGVDKPNRISNRWLAILLALIAFVAYANTLNHGFALDDRATLLGNPYVAEGIDGLATIFSTPYHPNSINNVQSTHTGDQLYRPLSLATFALEKSITDMNPATGHFINVMLFCGCVVVLFYFLEGLFGGARIVLVFVAAALFALHPIHTEVVANLKSRDELLCFLMGFVSLRLFINYANSGKVGQLLVGGCAFLLAMLSKETVVSFALIIPLLFFIYLNENRKRSIAIILCSAFACMVWVGIRYWVFHQYHSYDPVPFMFNPLTTAPSAATRIATAVLVMGHYLRLLFVPHPLVCMYGYPSVPFVSFADPWVIVSVLCYAGLLFWGIRLLVGNRKSPLAFGILFYLITMALFSNLFVTIGALMAERFLFFGSVGFCIAIAFCIEKLIESGSGNPGIAVLRSARSLYILGPLCCIYLLLTINRNSEWKNSYTVLTADVVKSPNDASLNYNLGNEYMSTIFNSETIPVRKKQALEDGLGYMRQSLALYADNVVCHTDMQFAFVQLQQYDSAEAHGLAALRVESNNAVALKNLGIAYFGNKKYPQSIAAFRKGIALTPWDMILYSNIALCFTQTSQYDSVVAYCRLALKQDANYGKAYVDMAAAFERAGVRDSAAKYEGLARQFNPGFRL